MIIDKKRFLNAKESALDVHKRFNIGTYKERSKHLILKLYYEPDEQYHEIKIENFYADICRDQSIIEIQTSGFSRLKNKIEHFINNGYSVKVVYPISIENRISWCDTMTGDIKEGSYRKYKKAKYNFLYEFLPIVDLLNNEKFNIDLVFVKSTSYRILDGYDITKKKKATKTDLVIDDIIEIITINSIVEIRKLLNLENNEYRISDFEKMFGYHRMKLWKAIKFLEISNIISLSRIENRTKYYRIV